MCKLTKLNTEKEEHTEPTVELPHTRPCHATWKCGPPSMMNQLGRKMIGNKDYYKEKIGTPDASKKPDDS